MTTLDVGCGRRKRGDIGVDIQQSYGVDFIVDLNKQPLPFPDNSFENVISSHCLEHLENPEYALKEMIRVAKRNVKVTVPHRYSHIAKGNDHISLFRCTWFTKFASKYGLECWISVNYESFLCFIRPYEIVAEFFKGAK